MEVKTHNSTLGGEAVFRPRRVLNSEAADQACTLFQEIIRPISNRKHIFVPGVPADGSDVLFSGFLCRKAPERKNRADLGIGAFFGYLLEISVVMELDFFCILYDHAFHESERSFHRIAKERIFFDSCFLFIIFFFASLQSFSLLILLFLLDHLELLHVLFINLPLVG